MSALKTSPFPRAVAVDALRSRHRVRFSVLAVPLGVAVAYVVVLVIRFPQIIAWQNADSDVASWYLLGAAAGHAGPLQLSGQGIWPQMLLMHLTDSLSWHRVLWELMAPTISVVAVLVVARSVASTGGRAAGLLAVTILVACSPAVLMCAISLGWHDTTPLGVALLGAHLVWLQRRPRRAVVLWGSVLAVAFVSGILLACDELLGPIGLLPYLLAAGLGSLGGGDRRSLMVAVATAALTVAVRIVTLGIGARLGVAMEGLPLGLTLHGAWVRAVWLLEGLLRIGNGLALGPHPALQTPLIVACGLFTIGAFGAVARLAVRAHHARRESDAATATALHTSFWTIAIVGACLSYVFSDQVTEPSDRYLVIVLYAVAATVPLLIARGRWVMRAVEVGVILFVAGSLVALGNGEVRDLMYEGADVSHIGQIEALVARDHLGLGYAGYWDAASLQWSSGGRLTVHPLVGDHRIAAAMVYLRAADWYRPRAHTPSYLILAPGDQDFPDRRPRMLPRPARVYHLGGVTIDAWPYDIAAFLRPSPIPVPGLSAAALRQARRSELRSAGS